MSSRSPSKSSTRLPTVVDVATLAKVSRQTVSNVLNAPEIVAPETRSRVEDAISLLGYRPHASARRLRTRKSSTLGVRLDPMQNGISGAVLDRFLHALTEQADADGLRIMLFTAADQRDEIRHYQRLMDGADVDAFVLTSTTLNDPRIDWLADKGADFVTFGRPWGRDLDDPTCRWVDVDGRAGAGDATRELLRRGARNIAFFGWPQSSGIGNERRAGWRGAMTEAGLHTARDLDALDVATVDSVPLATAAVERLIADGVEFDGLVCASDSLALGALMALGTRVPIVGFDNTPVAGAVGLSSVSQPVEAVAASVLRLLRRSPGPATDPASPGARDHNHELIRPTVIWRTSNVRQLPS